MSTNKTVEIGAFGWRHDGWQGNYYPDELPSDWLLSFYNKEFRCVVLPAADLHDDLAQLSRGEPLDWLDDLYDDFEFYVELDQSDLGHPDPHGRLVTFIELLESCFQGFVFQPDDCSTQDLAALAELARQLSCQAHVLTPTGFDWAAHSADYQDVLKQCWSPQQRGEVTDCQVYLLNVAVSEPDLPVLGADYRDFIAQLADGAHATIFVMGNPPSLKILKESQAIMSLLI